MTSLEWRAKQFEARREFDAEKAAGAIPADMTFDAWRVTKGYIVDGKEGLTTDEGHGN